MSIDVRWKQRFENFKKAVMQFTEFIEKDELNKFEVQGLIQCFEYTFELAWKTMKDYLEQEGFDVKSPRNVIQTAFQIQLITDGHTWIDALEKRSRAKGNYKPESDVDIGIYGENITFDTVSALHAMLEEKGPLPYFFDIVDYTHLSHKELKEHIDRVGKVIFEKGKSNP
ncbi:MAG: hypothetical protein PWQ60_597 [Thermoanaerobacteraceae bacterium]|jgi:nucleotidyltransferase substrate binding protein (TIGR01987 family)|nr:hypothetical protein [Thermoanaerobacteraceae bacterium]